MDISSEEIDYGYDNEDAEQNYAGQHDGFAGGVAVKILKKCGQLRCCEAIQMRIATLGRHRYIASYFACDLARYLARTKRLNANGVPSFSPGLRGTSYPGFTHPKRVQP